jgi:hypothetical protein
VRAVPWSERRHAVSTDCQTIQEVLTERGGVVDHLDPAQREHVSACPQCGEVAAAELALAHLFSKAVPPADLTVEESVRSALRPVRIRRRVVAFLPVAASLFIALLGAIMVGGLPGAGTAALLPLWTAQGWVALATGASDWGAALATGVRAVGTAVDPAILAGAGLVSLLGLAVVGIAALRWRRVPPWRTDD